MQLNNLLSFKKLLAINLITIISWQSLSYGANIGISLIYTYIAAILLFHIPNLVLTKHLLNAPDGNTQNNHNLIYLINTKLNYLSNVVVTLCTWLSNVVGYPSVFAFILSNVFYVFHCNVSKTEYFICIIMLYLAMSTINIMGFKISFKAILFFSLIGVFIPMALIIGYSFYYTLDHYVLVKTWLINVQLAHPFNLKDLNFGFILAIVMTIIGFEQSSLHVEEMVQHKFQFKNYHLIISSICILTITLFMMLVLSYIATTEHLDPNYLIAGTIIGFFKLIHYPKLAQVFIILFAIGEFGCVFAWMVHINRTFNATLLIAKSPTLRSWGSNYTPKKLIKFELVIFLVYFILLKIFPVLETSVILYNLSVQLSILYYVVLYLAIIREKSLPMLSRVILIIGLITSVFGVVCSLIPNMVL